ncbi:MAG TPA: hypothetical protein VFM18_17725 [Methanosarcina sp.]|nr:hypothetical protein [Methanosarcina sp.]
MWVVYQTYTLEVVKTTLTKAEAKKIAEYKNKGYKFFGNQLPYRIEEFPVGKLDEWLTYKILTKE